MNCPALHVITNSVVASDEWFRKDTLADDLLLWES